MAHPLIIRDHLQLNDYGIDPSQISFGEVSMESEKYLACNYKASGSSGVLIIDMETLDKPVLLPISVESVNMHPGQKIFALKCGMTLRIIDMSKNCVVNKHKSKDAIIFWKWIDETTIGFITRDGTVFHWALADHAIPARMFVVDRKLRDNFRIIDYRVDTDHKFCAVIGQAKNSRVSPLIQLFDVQSGASLLFEGQALRFAQSTLGNNCLPSNMLIYCAASTSPRKHVMKIIDNLDNNQICYKSPVSTSFSLKLDTDAPLSIHVSPKKGVVYLSTTLGFVHIFDVESGLELYSCSISKERLFHTADHSDGGLIAISRKGTVSSVSIDEESMTEHVSLWNKEHARKLSLRWSLQSQNTLPVPKPSPQHPLGNVESPDHWKFVADKLERERDELANQNRELERKYRKALIMMGRADQREHG